MPINFSAPAKIIISGEHAVVYGAPAIAMPAENHFATTSIVETPKLGVSTLFILTDLNYKKAFTIADLIALKNNLQNKYALFLAKKCAINEVLLEQAEIFPFALVKFAEYFALQLQLSVDIILQEFLGTEINITADIPLHCGMGSSAATLVSLLKAFLEFLFTKKIITENSAAYLLNNYFACFTLAREIENLQHGYSSGLDISVALQNQAIYFIAGKIFSRKYLTFPFHLLNTGRPESSTGECVTSVAKFFQDKKLLADFAAITDEIDKILQADTLSLINLKQCIKENHRLLSKIGVVPEKVQNLILELERQGFAAKITGAGAVKGDNAGVVLVIGEK